MPYGMARVSYMSARVLTAFALTRHSTADSVVSHTRVLCGMQAGFDPANAGTTIQVLLLVECGRQFALLLW